MKRSLYYLVLVVVVAIMAAWSASRYWSAYRVQKAEEVAKAAESAESRKWADHFAKLARECDEVVIKDLRRDNKSIHEIRFSDRAWISNLASVLEVASFKSTTHGLWISYPIIEIYRKQSVVLEIMIAGTSLRVKDAQFSCEFVTGENTATAIPNLLLSKQQDD